MALYRAGGRTWGSAPPISGGVKGLVQRGFAGEEEGGVPEWDRGKIAGLAQEQMAPFYGELRRGLLSSKARRYSTPTAREGAIRAYTRGAFEALPAAQAGATRTAMGLYQPEYQREYREWLRQQEEEEKAARMATPIGGGTSYRQVAAGMPSLFEGGGGLLRVARPQTERPSPYRRVVGSGTGYDPSAIEELQALSGAANGGYDPSTTYGG